MGPTNILAYISVHGMLFQILENDNTEETVKDAVAKALIRTLAPRKMPKSIFRLAAFQCQGPSIYNKIVKYLKKVSISKKKNTFLFSRFNFC